jgi:hypothetical protein
MAIKINNTTVIDDNRSLVATREVRVVMGSGTSIDLNSGNYFTRTITATTTFSVTNVPSSGIATSFILDLTNGGSQIVNWWSNLRWDQGIAPTLTSSGRDVLSFYTHDGGSNWTGLLVAKDVK